MLSPPAQPYPSHLGRLDVVEGQHARCTGALHRALHPALVNNRGIDDVVVLHKADLRTVRLGYALGCLGAWATD